MWTQGSGTSTSSVAATAGCSGVRVVVVADARLLACRCAFAPSSLYVAALEFCLPLISPVTPSHRLGRLRTARVLSSPLILCRCLLSTAPLTLLLLRSLPHVRRLVYLALPSSCLIRTRPHLPSRVPRPLVQRSLRSPRRSVSVYRRGSRFYICRSTLSSAVRTSSYLLSISRCCTPR